MSTQSPAKEFLAVFLTIVAAVLVATALFFFGTKIIISQLTDPRRRSDFYNPLIDLFGLSCFFVLTAALFDVFFLALMPRRLRSISLYCCPIYRLWSGGSNNPEQHYNWLFFKRFRRCIRNQYNDYYRHLRSVYL
jgi:hypothetical protein